ncbi:MAG TPA: hypothetical protein VEC08_01570 [Nitrososphaerales archaeon]|nr:hypothetical protein [Nitrososphaerales archaeon]
MSESRRSAGIKLRQTRSGYLSDKTVPSPRKLSGTIFIPLFYTTFRNGV